MVNDADEARERRRAERMRWAIARYCVGDEPSDDLSALTTPAERVAMMWILAESAWKIARRPWPTYTRRNLPARLVRPGTRSPDDAA